MNIRTNSKNIQLSQEVRASIDNVCSNYNLSWRMFKKYIDEINKNIPSSSVKCLKDHNQWCKIYKGEIGKGYSYEWWATLKIIVDMMPAHIDKKAKSLDSGIEKPEESKTFLTDLKQLGIIGTANKLSESKFKPDQCMKDTTRVLYFMGLLGSKWVKNINTFKEFLIKIQGQPSGRVRFLMINPKGNSFKILKSMRGECLKDKSTKIFYDLCKEFPCLEAKFYDFMPSFRLVFIDNKIVAVSRYKLDKDNYIKSKQGWEAPHLVIKLEESEWSLFEPFHSYFKYIWNNSTDINELYK